MNKKIKSKITEGTIRIRTKDLQIVERKNNSWKKSNQKFAETMDVIKLFKSHNNLDILVDKKNPQFLKGQVSKEGKLQGARINVLPDGIKLNGAFSLFAKNLTIHDETSNNHWDVLYKNPSGGFSHLYTLLKKKLFVKKKYKSVNEFEKYYSKLSTNVFSALKSKNDEQAVPMYTLLKTYMRVGNEIYFKAHNHKGLTTLKKKDILIKGDTVTFKYLSKGGVPRIISKTFPAIYLKRLQELLKPLKNSSFVFVNQTTGHPLKDVSFMKAFKRYCGKEFYPHIVRSYYATTKAKEFLKEHKSASKDEIKTFYLEIAEKLGHKKFSKKSHLWEDNYSVTIHHYIQPELVEKINAIAE